MHYTQILVGTIAVFVRQVTNLNFQNFSYKQDFMENVCWFGPKFDDDKFLTVKNVRLYGNN